MLTWGVNEFTDESTGRKSYDLFIQFPQENIRRHRLHSF